MRSCTRSTTLVLIHLLTLTHLTFAEPTHTILVSTAVPSNTSPHIDTSFLGFAFEQASFYNYSFDSQGAPNTFSQNLIQSVLDRTGVRPLIRVGGTSGDHAHFNASQDTATNFPATEFGVHFHAPYLSIGPKYFHAFKSFPGAKYEFQVPWNQWEDGPHMSDSLQWARHGLHAIGRDNLYALELGNEPNYYSRFAEDNGMNKTKYVEQYRDFESALKDEFPWLRNREIFQALDMASSEAGDLPTSDAVRLGLSNDASSIRQVAYHYYQGHGANTTAELQDWVSHHKTMKQMEVFGRNANWLHKHYPDIAIVLDEVGDNVGSGAVRSKISNCLASALWRVDFMLHAMAIGIDRINFQQIFGIRSGIWVPVKSDREGVPQVTANYYAMPFAADFIGSSGHTRVAPLSINDNDSGELVAYAAYDSGKLAGIAILNLHVWTPDVGDRPSRSVSINNLPSDIGEVSLHHLSGPDGALQKHGITWKGLQWTFESHGKDARIKDDSLNVIVSDGKMIIDLHDTSAVIIEF